MKKLFKFALLVGAGAYLYKHIKKLDQRESQVIEFSESQAFQQQTMIDPISHLSHTLIQSYKIQVLAMMSTYPKDKQIDLRHHIRFMDFTSLNNFTQELDHHYKIEDDLELIELMVKEAICTEAQDALYAIIKIAELTDKHQGIYQSFNLENLR